MANQQTRSCSIILLMCQSPNQWVCVAGFITQSNKDTKVAKSNRANHMFALMRSWVILNSNYLIEIRGKQMTQPMGEDELLQRVKEAVHALSPTAEIILYGSRARGTAQPDSDWDFLILLPSSSNKTLELLIKDRLYDVELETDTVLSSIIRSKQDWRSPQYAVMPLRQQIEKDGVPL